MHKAIAASLTSSCPARSETEARRSVCRDELQRLNEPLKPFRDSDFSSVVTDQRIPDTILSSLN